MAMEEMEPRCRRAARERTSPDTPKLLLPPMKKLQVFYYLSRNGRLDQPHFIELNHFANHPLRLKDVLDRLTVLRGKAMPSLYSWSCKRSYKSGYVWNDLSENDVIHPAEGAEYVLKGSELVEGSSEKLQQVHVSNGQSVSVQEPNLPSKPRRPLVPSPLRELDDRQDYELEYDEVEEYEYEYGEKSSYTSSATPHSRCSRGVSTEELEEHETRAGNQKHNESTRFDSARLSTTSPIATEQQSRGSNGSSKRFSDNNDETAIEPAPSRNSVLLQFIACGSSAVSKAKNGPCLKEPVKDMGGRTDSLRKGVVCKAAGKQAGEEDMINYMSENPRFGNLQSEEKEYFSGSIVESMREDRYAVLKKSSSYNEEKSRRGELGGRREGAEKREEEEEEEAGGGGGGKGRCIPRMKSAASSRQAKKA